MLILVFNVKPYLLYVGRAHGYGKIVILPFKMRGKDFLLIDPERAFTFDQMYNFRNVLLLVKIN